MKQLFALGSMVSALLRDAPRYRHAFRSTDDTYLRLANRGEELERAPEGTGYRCLWQWTSELRPARVLPWLGLNLMERVLREHPIRFAGEPEHFHDQVPQVSFLIGHRGMARVPQLLATLKSIAAQSGALIECIVVEQDTLASLPPFLPKWVRHVHTPPPAHDLPYCRSWAFNVAARHAQAPVLVLHDNDMLVPADYAAQILNRVQRGYDVVNLKRFIFYLAQTHSTAVSASATHLLDEAPESVVQNLEAGGSVAITADAFRRIGGMDESFVGWGGEDNEFWERATTLRVWPWANLPIVHLWHAAQPGKGNTTHAPLQRYAELSRIAPDERIARLSQAALGEESGPCISEPKWPCAADH